MKQSYLRQALISAIFIGISSIVYIFISAGFKFNLANSPFPYFSLLTESFFNRRYDLIHPPANPFDLSVYKGAVYLPWGPFPAVALMPLFTFVGTLSDRVYTALFGALNVGIFYLVLIELYRYLQRKRDSFLYVLTLFFGFGTVHFSMTTIARVWFTSQVLSLTPFLCSLLFLIRFLYTKKPVFYIISFGFFLLAFMGRVWYIFFLPTYVLLLLTTTLNRKQLSSIALFVFIFSMIVFRFYGLYNFRRFGSVFETGYNYQRESQEFISARAQFGRYNPRYFLQNVWYELLNPVMVSYTFPFISADKMGNGLFATSPLFLLLFFIPKVYKKYKWFILSCSAGVLFFVMQTLLFFGTGYSQFGHRYLLEIIPFLILLIVCALPYINKKLVYVTLIFSLFFHSMGAVWLVMNY